MIVVLLGPDGAGKSTLIRRLEAEPELNALGIYMGRNPHERRTVLPAPRWIRRHRPGSRTRLPPILAQLAKSAAFSHLLIEQWLCYASARLHRRRGGLVLFDRYLLNLGKLPGARPPGIRLRGGLLRLGAPDPDLVIVLDAPGDVLYARKEEHSPDALERRRGEYRRMADELQNAFVVDATQGVEVVAAEVRTAIRARGGGARVGQAGGVTT